MSRWPGIILSMTHTSRNGGRKTKTVTTANNAEDDHHGAAVVEVRTSIATTNKRTGKPLPSTKGGDRAVLVLSPSQQEHEPEHHPHHQHHHHDDPASTSKTCCVDKAAPPSALPSVAHQGSKNRTTIFHRRSPRSLVSLVTKPNRILKRANTTGSTTSIRTRSFSASSFGDDNNDNGDDCSVASSPDCLGSTVDSKDFGCHDDSAQTPAPASPPAKGVSFGTVSVRTYPQILGDHPCCTSGCPVTLDWHFLDEQETTVDNFENTDSDDDDNSNGQDEDAPRIRRASSSASATVTASTTLRLTYPERYAIVTADDSISSHELRKLCRKQSRGACRTFKETRRQQRHLSKTFFFADDAAAVVGSQ